MKKVKYLIGIIIICIVVFIGIEVFRKTEHEEIDNANTSENTVTEQNNTEKNTDNTQLQNTTTQNNTTTSEEIKDGQDLIERAEKTLTARGWAGASNNVVGIKDNILYYYNKETGEFRKIATGIEDIYYKTDESEYITVKQGNNSEKIGEELEFLIYE